MRRREREVTDIGVIDRIITSCDCCRIALCDGENAPYIVPVSFGYEHTADGCFFYFHGAREGRKLELMARNPNAGFELDSDHQVVRGGRACDYSTHYCSVIGTGRLERVSAYADKLHALDCIMAHYEPGRKWSYAEKAVHATEILRLTVGELSCKAYES